MDRYSHVSLTNERTALESLPVSAGVESQSQVALKTGTDNLSIEPKKTDTKTDVKTAKTAYFGIHTQSLIDNINFEKTTKVQACKSFNCKTLDLNLQGLTLVDTGEKEKAAPGFEPGNNGFANRRLRPLGYAAKTLYLQ